MGVTKKFKNKMEKVFAMCRWALMNVLLPLTMVFDPSSIGMIVQGWKSIHVERTLLHGGEGRIERRRPRLLRQWIGEGGGPQRGRRRVHRDRQEDEGRREDGRCDYFLVNRGQFLRRQTFDDVLIRLRCDQSYWLTGGPGFMFQKIPQLPHF